MRRHQDRVFGILRMLDARDEAMELTQDVFVKALAGLAFAPEARFFHAGCCRSRNAALDQLRRRRKWSSSRSTTSMDVADTAPEAGSPYASRQRARHCLTTPCSRSPPSTARSCCARSRT